jgi:hypothetical protein
MASERSSYRKIQEVLAQAKSVKTESIEDLRKEIAARDPNIFRTFQYDHDTDTMLPRISERVIRQSINLCRLLDLVASNGQLTDLGRIALRPTKYNEILAVQIRRKMEEQNINLTKLNNIIVKILRSTPLVLPTSEVLWKESGGNMTKISFTKFLTLLSSCGCANSAQKKIYLHIDTEND